VIIIFAIIFILFFYGATNYYIGVRIFQGLSFLFPHMNAKIYAGIFVFIALSLIVAIMPLPSGIKRIMSWVGSHWMGIFVYLLMFFLMADLVILFGSIVNIIPNPIPQSIRFYVGLTVLLLATCLVIYGMHNAKQIKHVSYDIQAKETTLTTNIKIVLISDLHLGAISSEKQLESIVRGINNLDPDIVCLAGDIFNDDYNAIRDPDKAIDLFQSINSTYGVYGCLGNHDGGKTFEKMVSLLEQSNIKLLNDEYVIIDERLVLLGRIDPSPIGGFGELKRKDITEILATIGTDIPIVVMDHTPSNIEQYGREIDLLLAGHTHRGQIFPFNYITKSIFTLDYGHYQKDAYSPHVIVTSGVSTWGMPMRIGSNSEIVSILLR